MSMKGFRIRKKPVNCIDSRACPENFITVSTSQAILRILEIHTTHFREFLAIISFSGGYSPWANPDFGTNSRDKGWLLRIDST